MKTEDIHELTERFLNGKTTLKEEQLLYEYYGKHDVDPSLQHYASLFRGLGMVSHSVSQPSRGIPLWLKVWRTVSTVAAIFLLVLLVTTNLRQPVAPPHEENQPYVALSECPSGLTLREKALCYLQHREAHRSIYKQLKQLYNESHQ